MLGKSSTSCLWMLFLTMSRQALCTQLQIDSLYQQLIFEGVITETIKHERVLVIFTVEGYFYYILGEVIEQQTADKGAPPLKELLENR